MTLPSAAVLHKYFSHDHYGAAFVSFLWGFIVVVWDFLFVWVFLFLCLFISVALVLRFAL